MHAKPGTPKEVTGGGGPRPWDLGGGGGGELVSPWRPARATRLCHWQWAPFRLPHNAACAMVVHTACSIEHD